MRRPYRQGDVLLVPIDQIPNDCKLADGPVVLALGEEHGHSHRFADDSKVLGFYKEGAEDHTMAGGSALVGGATRIHSIEVPVGGADLLHVGDEVSPHNPIPVEPGAYEVHRQREFVADGIERAVVD